MRQRHQHNFFVSKQTISKSKTITYANFVCNIELSKTETHLVRLTVGGDQLTYDSNPSSPAIILLGLNIHINSVISKYRKGPRYMTEYIINYYLNNSMSNFQSMRIHIRDIPHEVIVEYSLLSIADFSG